MRTVLADAGDHNIIEEISLFSSEYSLSEREQDILSILVTRASSTENIARQLKISHNTVNNHLKKIMEKTQCTSKTALVSSFCKFIYKRLSHLRFFARKPRVLIVDDEDEILELLQEHLDEFGFKVYTESEATKALERIPLLYVDFLITDIRMPGMDGYQLTKAIRKTFPNYPIIFMVTGFSQYRLDACLHEGAAGLFAKPIDLDHVNFTLVEHYIDSQYERNRFLRIDANLPVEVNKTMTLKAGNIGFGGAFIPLERTESWKKLSIKVGGLVELRFFLEDSETSIKAITEVVWIRREERPGMPAGFGVRFKQIADDDLEHVREFVRINRIRSFVPKGLVEDQ